MRLLESRLCFRSVATELECSPVIKRRCGTDKLRKSRRRRPIEIHATNRGLVISKIDAPKQRIDERVGTRLAVSRRSARYDLVSDTRGFVEIEILEILLEGG